MAKKELTAKQKQTKYRALQYTTFAGEFVSILTPFIIMGAVNAKDWFYQEDGWKVGFGGTLALALMGIAIFAITKKKEKDNEAGEKIPYGYIALLLGWFATAFIFMMLASIMEQITTIMLFGGFGLLGAFGLEMTSQNFKNKADMYKAAIQKVDNELLEEEIKEEKKTIKIKVKKEDDE